ncbi:MAG TPA: RNA 2',3'-cyclic phosphodiesterase [Bryobacteraceae bacterium]|nr:RNA 2',3'-cyclic phosphodiesterase [Bryobacteraceae bacterium]
MRLFTGFDLPAEVVRALEELLDQLRPAARIKWIPPANLHITTRFIGEWPEERLAELRAALAGIPSHAPIPMHIRKLGYFPNPHSPRVVWAGVEAGPDLAALAAETDRALEPLGLQPEGRPFSPHLTLARIKEPVPLQRLRETVVALPSLEFGSFTADRFFLYQSRLGPAGSVYSKLAEFPLAGCGILGQGEN